jgi:hypothetical protein
MHLSKMNTFLNVHSLGALTVRVIKYTKQICKNEENNSTESNFVEKVLVNLVYRSIKLTDMI